MDQNDKSVKHDVLRAAEKGNTEEVNKKLAQGEDVNTADAWGNTPLYLAAWGGHEELVRRLLSRGARIDQQNAQGQTALHTACERGHGTIARLLVERGANVDPESNYLPPLHFAMFHCDCSLVDQLIEKGADIDRVDAGGATTLHRACWCDCDTVVEMLLDRGAKTDVKNQSGMTALDYASVYGHSAVVEVFIRKFPEMISSQDNKGWNSLHKASAENNTTFVMCLLNNGADVDRATKYGSTPLHLALRKGSFEAAEILLHRGARIGIKDNKGNTPLHEAVAAKLTVDVDAQISVFRKLLNRGASVDMKNYNNDTPFDLCRKDERYQVLVEHVTKLRVAGLFVGLENKVSGSEVENKCYLELEKIEKTKICENISLNVVFLKVLNPYYLRNERLRLSLDRLLQSSRALEWFPMYIYVLRNTLHTSKCRLTLLTSVNQVLSNDEQNLWWNTLPALVQECVLLHLTNDDLEKLQ